MRDSADRWQRVSGSERKTTRAKLQFIPAGINYIMQMSLPGREDMFTYLHPRQRRLQRLTAEDWEWPCHPPLWVLHLYRQHCLKVEYSQSSQRSIEDNNIQYKYKNFGRFQRDIVKKKNCFL